MDRDHMRRCYKLYFPTDVDAEQVIKLLRSLSGTLKGSANRFTGVPAVTFELWSSRAGIEHRVRVPWQHAEYVVKQLYGHVPGIRVEHETNPPKRLWTHAVELGMTTGSRSLFVPEPVSLSHTILKSVEGLRDNQAVLMQWTITPSSKRQLPVHGEATSHHFNPRMFVSGNMASRDEVNDRRAKLEEPNFSAVLRVAATASTPKEAEHLTWQLKQALSSTHTASVRFTKRFVTRAALQRRLDEAAASVVMPITVNAAELAGLLAWRIGNPLVAGLPRPLGKQFPPHDAISSKGMVLGQASFPGSERDIALDFEQAMMHTHVLGSTGVGKTILLSHMARQIMSAGFGLIVMETEGNLYQYALDYVPESRKDDVILLDISDVNRPVGFNVLDQGNPAQVIDEIIDLFAHRYGSEGVWSSEYIYHGLRTLAEKPGLTLIDLLPLLSPQTPQESAWTDSVVASLHDDDLRAWWQRHSSRDNRSKAQRTDPVLSRIWQLTNRPELKHVLGQSRSSFTMRDVLKSNKVLLINLKGVSRDTASLAGTLIMNAIWSAAKSTPVDRPNFVMLDEFADFMDLPVGTESMLAQARKHKLGLVLANQHMSQLKPAVRDAVVSNARNKLIFKANAEDGRMFAHEVGGGVEHDDVTELQAYEAIASLVTPTGTSGPVSIKTKPPAASTRNAGYVRDRSRRQYGRDSQAVRDSISERYQAELVPNQRQRPTVSGDGWG